jgi:hypothetical protein
MTTQVSTILSRVRTVLQDTDGTRWPTAELLSWGNEIQLLVVDKFPAANTSAVTLNLAPGSKQEAPSGSLALVDVRRNTTGPVVTACDRKALDAFSPNWMGGVSSTTIKHWMPDEKPIAFWVYPPAAPGASVDVVVSVAPMPLTENGVIGIRDEYASRLTNGILYRAISKDAEFSANLQLAEAYFKLAFE